MPKHKLSHLPTANQLLSLLPRADFQRLSPTLRFVSLPTAQVLYEAHAPIDFAYFPSQGVISATTVMEDGREIEVATVGNEGMVGLTALIGADISPNRVYVQVQCDALRMEAKVFKRETSHDGPLRRLLLRYHSAYLTQVSYSVACNGLHTVQKRCCRWLLMTQDRVGSDVLALTHEFLAIMLGVRRASVTEVLHPLRERGWIGNHRGKIQVLNRAGLEAASCECYRSVKEEFNRMLGTQVA